MVTGAGDGAKMAKDVPSISGGGEGATNEGTTAADGEVEVPLFGRGCDSSWARILPSALDV